MRRSTLKTERPKVTELLASPAPCTMDWPRAALQNSAIGFAVTNGAGLFVSANDAFCRLTGYSAEELRMLSPLKIVHPDDAELYRDIIRQNKHRNTDGFCPRKENLTKSGRTIWVRSLAHIVRDSHQRRTRFCVWWKILRNGGGWKRRRAGELPANCMTRPARISAADYGPRLTEDTPRDSIPRHGKPLPRVSELAKQAANEVRTLSFVLYPPAVRPAWFGRRASPVCSGIQQPHRDYGRIGTA